MAFVNSWDVSTPSDIEDHKLGASRIRELKSALEERLAIDHSWDGDTEDGKHEAVTLKEQAAAPVPAANEGSVYTLETAGKAELYFKDEDGNATQLTDVGKLAAALLRSGGSMTGALVMENDISIAAEKVDATPLPVFEMSNTDVFNLGHPTVAMALFGTAITFAGGKVWHEGNDGDGSGLDADTYKGETVDAFIEEARLDSQPGYMHFANGFLVQWGNESGGDTDTVTLPLAYDSANYGVALAQDDSSKNFRWITSKAAASFVISREGSGTRSDFWITVGFRTIP